LSTDTTSVSDSATSGANVTPRFVLTATFAWVPHVMTA